MTSLLMKLLECLDYSEEMGRMKEGLVGVVVRDVWMDECVMNICITNAGV